MSYDDPQAAAIAAFENGIDAADYLRQCDIQVENLINPNIGTTLNLTLAQYNLAPNAGAWNRPAPQQGEQINFGGNPGQWSASNTSYPGEVKGFMTFAVQTHATLTLRFGSSLTAYGATINGQAKAAWVNGFLFTLTTTISPTTSQPIYTVKAIQYKKPH